MTSGTSKDVLKQRQHSISFTSHNEGHHEYEVLFYSRYQYKNDVLSMCERLSWRNNTTRSTTMMQSVHQHS